MNDFASALSATLHKEAKEMAMSVDMQQAENTLRQNMRSRNRRKVRTSIAVAAAAVVVVAGGIAFAVGGANNNTPPVAPPTSQSPSAVVTYPLDASQMKPPLTAQLPYWVAEADFLVNGPAFQAGYNCEAPSGLCADGQDRRIDMFSIQHMYPLDGATNISPTYDQYVQAWTDVERLGYGTVTDVAATTVGGRPATTMTVVVTQQMSGLAGCELATDAKDSGGCFGQVPGRTLNLAIVNQGTGQPPTLLMQGLNTTNTAEAQAVADEFTTWLGTVQFS